LSSYLAVIKSGFLAFPAIALACLVPYMVFEYRRYGSIPLWKTFVVFSFILYAICAYYLIILPLPADHTAYVATAATPQLVPFKELHDVLAYVNVDWTTKRGLLSALRTSYVYQILFNVALLMPLGAFAHYLFHRRWWQVIALGFAVSLFFELTQYSGLYGIYNHPYRLFDVDDLICNTTGALLGFQLALPLCHLLPDIREVNERATERGMLPSFTRRLLAFCLDFLVVGILVGVWALVAYTRAGVAVEQMPSLSDVSSLLVLAACVGVEFMLVPAVTGGQTLGQRLLRMRVVRTDGSRAPWYCLVGRYGLLVWFALMGPLWVTALAPSSGVEGVSGDDIVSLAWALQMVWMGLVLLRAVAARLSGHAFKLLCGTFSGTCVMSCAMVDELREGRQSQEPEPRAQVSQTPQSQAPRQQVQAPVAPADDDPYGLRGRRAPYVGDGGASAVPAASRPSGGPVAAPPQAAPPAADDAFGPRSADDPYAKR
jgi:glycopeptide antibiotics resistance protein